MASLYIKDSATAERFSQVAERLNVTKTETLRLALDALERELSPENRAKQLLARLDAWRRDHPLPPATGRPADKAFFDELWGED